MRSWLAIFVVMGCCSFPWPRPAAGQQLGINLSHQISASHGRQWNQQQILRQQRGFGASHLDLDGLAVTGTGLPSDSPIPQFLVPAAGLPAEFRLTITNLDQVESVTTMRREQSSTVLFSHSPLFRASN